MVGTYYLLHYYPFLTFVRLKYIPPPKNNLFKSTFISSKYSILKPREKHFYENIGHVMAICINYLLFYFHTLVWFQYLQISRHSDKYAWTFMKYCTVCCLEWKINKESGFLPSSLYALALETFFFFFLKSWKLNPRVVMPFQFWKKL